MKRAKGLDDLLLIDGQPRIRSYHRAPPGLTQRRTPQAASSAGPIAPGLTLEAARETTVDAVHAFVSNTRGNRGKGQLISTPPGAGKSYAIAEAMASPGTVARIVAGTKALARELSEEYGWRLVDGRNEGNCKRYDVVESLAAAGHDIERLACGHEYAPRCPFRTNCAYFFQFEGRGHRVGSAEQIFNRHFLAGGNLVVVDDGDLLRSLVDRKAVGPEALAKAAKQFIDVPVQRAVALLLLATIEAPQKQLFGTRAWDHLAATAARRGFDLHAIVDGLPDVTVHDPIPHREDRVLEADDIDRSPPGSLAGVLDTLKVEADLFRTGEEFNSRLAISTNYVLVRRLRAHIQDAAGNRPIDGMALLVLDATPVEPLVSHLLANHERLPDVSARIALPDTVRVIQYATGGSGHRELARPAQVARVVAEIVEARGRFSALSQVREGLITYKGLQKAMEATGIPAANIRTFGSLRGINALVEVDRMLLVGRPMPPTDDVVALANVIYWGQEAVSGELALKERSYGGQPYSMTYLDFVDPRVSLLLKAMRDDEIEQAIHRARLFLAGPERQVHLFVHTSHPIEDLRVDELIVDAEPDLNDERKRDAKARIRAATQELIAEDAGLSVRTIADRAGADQRTVERALDAFRDAPTQPGGTSLGNVLETSIEKGGSDALGNSLEACIEDRATDRALGTSLETSLRDLYRGLHNVPHRMVVRPPLEPSSSWLPPGPRPDKPHWVPCPGECGRYLPPGQRCFDCAAAMGIRHAGKRR